MFSSGGPPAVLSVLKENLILVAGRVVLQTEMGLSRSVPGSFSFDFVSFLRILLCSVLSVSPSNLAKVTAAHFSLLQSLISFVSLNFSSAFHLTWPSTFLRFSFGLMLFSLEGVKTCLVDKVTESVSLCSKVLFPMSLSSCRTILLSRASHCSFALAGN